MNADSLQAVFELARVRIGTQDAIAEPARVRERFAGRSQ